jgi:hypothetical protein
MGEILETQWPGWSPSASELGQIGQGPKGLLKMDNLTLDENGHLRLSSGWKIEEPFPFDDIIGIFSTTLPNIGVQRYIFDASGNIYRTSLNPAYTGIGPFIPVAPTIVTGATGNRAAFTAILGHVFIIIGSTKKKDRGDVTFDLGVPAPAAPTSALTAPPSIDLNNLSAGDYTNWTSVDTSAFNNTGTQITATPGISSGRAVFQTVYGAPLDTTAFGGITGRDTDNDTLTFNFEIDDVTQLNFIKIELCHENPTGANPVHCYWFEWDFLNPPIPNSPYPPFNTTSGVIGQVSITRGKFFNYNFDPTKNWSNIGAIRVTVGMKTPVNMTISGFTFTGGLTSQINNTGIQYVAVAVRDTGSYLEFSTASAASVALDDTVNWQITVTPAGAVDAQANQYWLFRLDNTTGIYLLVDKQTGANGFTPAAFVDGRPSADLISDAAINPFNTLQFYRSALPNTIIDMIWFRDRMVYLTPDSFIPSFSLDPGSYDSRYVYQIAGGSGNAEVCLFIIKLDVGNFIIGTTKDFYRVTGTFSLSVDPTTGLTLQDVNIYPLGVSNPPISRAHAEFEGSIIYVAADGVRMLTNFVSNNINDELDLLFRREARYDLSPVRFAPNDTAPFSMAVRGKRVYITMPHYDGINRVYVCTFETSGYNVLNFSRYWRLITFGDYAGNPTILFTEEDGTILFGGLKPVTPAPDFTNGYLSAGGNYLRSLESSPPRPLQANINKMNQQAHITGLQTYLPMKFKTVFNYDGKPDIRKDATSLKIGGLDGHNVSGNIAIYGLNYDGTIDKVLLQFIAYGESVLEIDLKATDGFGNSLGPCLAFAVEISCFTDRFTLAYIALSYDERPPLIRRKLLVATDLDDYGRKRIQEWPFHVDLINPATVLTAIMQVDGAPLLPAQTFSGFDTPQTFIWTNPVATGTFGVSWRLEISSSDSMEFYKFEQPVIAQKMPGKIQYAIKPFTNFGKASPKKISTWPFVANPLGTTIQIKVTVDGVVYSSFLNTTDTRIRTWFWYNTLDIMGVDWQIEVFVNNPSDYFEFYGFLDPELLQVFPISKEIDQAGPFDLLAKALVTGMQIRVYPTGNSIPYKVYEDDVLVVSDTLTVTPNVDSSYIVPFPKGVNPSVCRIIFDTSVASQPFYRFNVEIRVRETGRETEEKFIKAVDRRAT